jgi:excinuclease ABC subunit C
VIEEVASDMRKAAADGDFERAARLRDTLFALREMTKAHFVRRSPSLAQAEARAGLEELREALGLERPLNTIECVDISNLFGTHSVASLVVARDGLPDRRYYRHFRIRTVEGADDPRSMAEVVRRRYAEGSSLLAGSPRADLFVCDGGITQLLAARAVFSELGIGDIPSVGLAEKREEIVLGDGRENLILPRDSRALFVLTRLRDEAHRFALSYHRKLRDRTIRESVLDEVPGIGEVKKSRLLKHFRSVRAIAKASPADVAAVAGVSPEVAEEVVKAAGMSAGEKL